MTAGVSCKLWSIEIVAPLDSTADNRFMASRTLNATERYLLTNYQHLMPPADRMIARWLVAADFDLDHIPRNLWKRVSPYISGIDAHDPWKLPIQICLRLLSEHRDEIYVPENLS